MKLKENLLSLIDLIKQGKSYKKLQEVINISFTTVGGIVKK